MSSLTTAAIPQELQRDALLTLEQLTTAVTVLALHGSHCPEDAPRVRAVFDQLVEVAHYAETDLAIFDLP
ncbi:hypothetical protein KBY85_05220 [Cyanobium sp. BA5m-10]|nr:hypothetical protein [Cyanobium sp. BA5m-10]